MNLSDLLIPNSHVPQVPAGLVRRCVRLVAWVGELVPDPAPLSGRDAAVTAYLFDEGHVIVGQTVRAMRRQRALFSGRLDPEPIHARQVRASGWRSLHLALQQLADLTGALYRLEQAGVTREVLRLLRHVREVAGSPFAAPEDVRRARALALPGNSLVAWQRRMRGGRATAKKRP